MQSAMGTFRVPIEIGSFTEDRFAPFEALVDTGATHTSIPREELERLGIRPEQQWPFVLADGREAPYDIAWARIRLAGRTQPTIVVFGDPGSEPLLGVVTLEEFRLGIDRLGQRLIPVPGVLKELAACPTCRESYLTAETLHELERLKRNRHTVAVGRKVEVVRFAA